MRSNLLPAALLLVAATAVTATPAWADPLFRGPEVHDGAWPVTRAWSDPAAGPDDRSQGSFAYAYRSWAPARADEHVASVTRLDCADLSIQLICEYAYKHGLPITWKVWYSPEAKWVNVSSSDKQFGSFEQFAEWSRWFLGAMNLADNTYAITYDDWTGGDMVLMNWNLSQVEPNFPGRQVWHTYLVGVPDQSIYYGNIDSGTPLPVTKTTAASTLDRVRNHPDRHGASPRRFSFMRNAVQPPQVRTDEAVVLAGSLNLRAAPSTSAAILARGSRDQRLPVLGRQPGWINVRLPDGRPAWASATYLRVETTWAAPVVETPITAQPSPPVTTGLTAAIPGQ